MTHTFHADNARLITGTFAQLDHWSDLEGVRFQEQLRAMDPDGWRRMLGDMARIGIDTVVFQQCIDARNGANDIRAYYPSRRWSAPEWLKPKAGMYGEIVDEADRLGMTVIHGIYAMFCPDPAAEVEAAIELGGTAAREIAELYGDSPSFGGFYWSYEYHPGGRLGRDSLKRIVPAIREICDCPFMIAPNGDRPVTPAILEDIDVDIVAYQDTVGLGVDERRWGRIARADRHTSLDRLPLLYDNLKFAHDAWRENEFCYHYRRSRGRTAIWNDLEIWEFDRDGALMPTEMSRIAAQLELTAPYVDKQIIYQYPGLMHNPAHPVRLGGERAATLYEAYVYYREMVLGALRPTALEPSARLEVINQ